VTVHTRTYTTPQGHRRRIRLYEAWLNLRGRLRGGKTAQRKRNYWTGHENEFLDWDHFRSWALANGYRRGVELDRIDPTKGYGPHNCQWLTKPEHTRKSTAAHKPRCTCVSCGWRHALTLVTSDPLAIPF
jgi:hypothetical protein